MKKTVSIYEDLFSKIGLNQSQSRVFEFLIKNGENTAGNISKITKIKRGLTYNALEELQIKGLVYKNTKLKVIKFGAEHPEKLREYIDNKEKEVRNIKNTLETILPSIVEDFNISSDRPGIRYMEGYDGVKKAFDELLKDNNGEEILNFFGVAMYVNDKKLLKIGFDYVDKREYLKIPQKTIAANSRNQIAILNRYIKDNLDKRTLKYEESRLIEYSNNNFNADINVCKNKLVIVSKNNDKVVSIIIDDKEVAKTLKSIFYLIWEK